MKVPGGYACTEEEINGSMVGIEPDWTIYADCLDCPAHWRGEDGEVVRYRADEHVRRCGHRVKWTDAEHEFYGWHASVIGATA